MNICVCGNELTGKGDTNFRIVWKPCQCEKPAGPRIGGVTVFADGATRDQYEQRKRLGLPVMTDTEKAALKGRR